MFVLGFELLLMSDFFLKLVSISLYISKLSCNLIKNSASFAFVFLIVAKIFAIKVAMVTKKDNKATYGIIVLSCTHILSKIIFLIKLKFKYNVNYVSQLTKTK